MEANKMAKKITVKVGADTTDLEIAIEKANQLKSLLAEVKELTDSLDLGITFKAI